MHRRIARSIAAMTLLGSCAVPSGELVQQGKDHPASPDAAPAAIEDPGRFLTGHVELDPEKDAPVEKATSDGHHHEH